MVIATTRGLVQQQQLRFVVYGARDEEPPHVARESNGDRMLTDLLEKVFGPSSSAPLKNENAHASFSGMTMATFFHPQR